MLGFHTLHTCRCRRASLADPVAAVKSQCFCIEPLADGDTGLVVMLVMRMHARCDDSHAATVKMRCLSLSIRASPYQPHSSPACYQRSVAGRCHRRHHSCLTDRGLHSHLHTIFVGSVTAVLFVISVAPSVQVAFDIAVASLLVFKNAMLLSFSLGLLEVEEAREFLSLTSGATVRPA